MLTIQDEGRDEVCHTNNGRPLRVVLNSASHPVWCQVPVQRHVCAGPPCKVDAARDAHAEQQGKHKEDDVVHAALNAAALGRRLRGIHEDLCVVPCAIAEAGTTSLLTLHTSSIPLNQQAMAMADCAPLAVPPTPQRELV